ncbi:SHSP domain-containing protein [Aphelenchoides besseyi]|nr:SHSP domain-containing protein [Aphelenchoides besseyi]
MNEEDAFKIPIDSTPGSWNTVMSTFNHSSSFNRSWERKVVEEGAGGKPSVQMSTPFQTITSTGFPFPTSSFLTPHNYHFGNCNGSFHSSDDSLQATLDVSDYAPEDLKVSVIGQYVVVEATHAEKADQLGLIERHFVRKFNLPRNANPEKVQSNLTSDGQLTVSVKSEKAKEVSPPRTIPIKVVTQPQNGSTA